KTCLELHTRPVHPAFQDFQRPTRQIKHQIAFGLVEEPLDPVAADPTHHRAVSQKGRRRTTKGCSLDRTGAQTTPSFGGICARRQRPEPPPWPYARLYSMISLLEERELEKSTAQRPLMSRFNRRLVQRVGGWS